MRHWPAGVAVVFQQWPEDELIISAVKGSSESNRLSYVDERLAAQIVAVAVGYGHGNRGEEQRTMYRFALPQDGCIVTA
jgi:hypothetical protein